MSCKLSLTCLAFFVYRQSRADLESDTQSTVDANVISDEDESDDVSCA